MGKDTHILHTTEKRLNSPELSEIYSDFSRRFEANDGCLPHAEKLFRVANEGRQSKSNTFASTVSLSKLLKQTAFMVSRGAAKAEVNWF